MLQVSARVRLRIVRALILKIGVFTMMLRITINRYESYVYQKYNSLANVQRIDYAQYTIQNTRMLYAVC